MTANTIEVSVEKSVCVIHLIGELSFETVEVMRDIVISKIESCFPKPMIIDMSELKFLDSGVVGLLVKIKRMADGIGIYYALSGVNGQPEIVLNMVGFTEHVQRFSSMDEAINSALKQQSQARGIM